jgi:hypothetical protein
MWIWMLITWTDTPRSCSQHDLTQPLSKVYFQDFPTVQSGCPDPSTGPGFRLDGLELGNSDLTELSYEDGLRLIDETYSAEDMDTDEDEMCFVPVETDQGLDDTIDKIIHNSQLDVLTGGSVYPSHQHCRDSGELVRTGQIDTIPSIIEARKLLQLAQHELEILQSIRQEMEPHHIGQLENYPTPPETPVE